MAKKWRGDIPGGAGIPPATSNGRDARTTRITSRMTNYTSVRHKTLQVIVVIIVIVVVVFLVIIERVVLFVFL